MVCPVQEHSKNYSSKATTDRSFKYVARLYVEVLFGSIVKHIVELYNDVGNDA